MTWGFSFWGMIMSKTAKLLDALRVELRLKNDGALAAALETDPPNVSRLRHSKRDMGPQLLLKIHDPTGWPLRDIKGALGIPCLASLVPAA